MNGAAFTSAKDASAAYRELSKYHDPDYRYRSPYTLPREASAELSSGEQTDLNRSTAFGRDYYKTLMTLFGGAGPFADTAVPRGMSASEEAERYLQQRRREWELSQERAKEQLRLAAAAPRLSPLQQYQIRLGMLTRGLGGIGQYAIRQQEQAAKLAGEAPWRPSYYVQEVQ